MRFYKTGVDITNDKQMFNFLRNHFMYYTANSWNGLKSIANNVKLYNLGLSGDWCVALNLLEADNYDTVNMIIHDWEREHPGYSVGFNGRSGGYLVLCNKGNARHVLPEEITDSVDYEDYKEYCREYFGSVKMNRRVLVDYVTLVRSFDKLCDELRDYCDRLSNQSFEITEMQKAVEEFNEVYFDDLNYLEFQELVCDAQGIVDLSEVIALTSLTETFLRIAGRRKEGYSFEWLQDNRIRLKKL
jgi:hypothetical protein